MKIAGGKLNLIIGIVIGVLAVVGLAVGLYFHFREGPPENVAMVRPGLNGKMVKLRPISTLRHYTIVTDSVDPTVLEEAVSWWNGLELSHGFTTSYDAQLLRTLEVSTTKAKKGFFLMHVASDQHRRGGCAEVEYDKLTGEIWTGEAVLNHDHVYDRATYVAAAEHEMGHFLGLDDDPMPGIDLNSIMRSKLLVTGTLSKRDREYLGGR
jgi:hypothetical protein